MRANNVPGKLTTAIHAWINTKNDQDIVSLLEGADLLPTKDVREALEALIDQLIPFTRRTPHEIRFHLYDEKEYLEAISVLEKIFRSKHCTEAVLMDGKQHYTNLYDPTFEPPSLLAQVLHFSSRNAGFEPSLRTIYQSRMLDMMRFILSLPSCTEQVLMPLKPAFGSVRIPYVVDFAKKHNRMSMVNDFLNSRACTPDIFDKCYGRDQLNYLFQHPYENTAVLQAILSSPQLNRLDYLQEAINVLNYYSKDKQYEKSCEAIRFILETLFDDALLRIKKNPDVDTDTQKQLESAARNAYAKASQEDKLDIIAAIVNVDNMLSLKEFKNDKERQYYFSCSDYIAQFYASHHSWAKPLASAIAAVLFSALLATSVMAAAAIGGIVFPVALPLVLALAKTGLLATSAVAVGSGLGAHQATKFAKRQVSKNKLADELQTVIHPNKK